VLISRNVKKKGRKRLVERNEVVPEKSKKSRKLI
jgi:hypothetical protein